MPEIAEDTEIAEMAARVLAESLRADIETLESAETEFGGLIDPTGFLRDDPSYAYLAGPQDLRGDRVNGANYPIYRTEAELGVIRAIGRAYADTTEHGQVILESLSAYVVGIGYQWNCVAKGKRENVNVEGIAEFLRDVLVAKGWPTLKEDEFFRRDVRDGETFLAIMDSSELMNSGDDSGIELRFIEPSQITEPDPATAKEICERYGLPYGCWTFGIHTLEGDVESVLGYFVRWTDAAGDWSYLPASRVVHSKRNVDSTVKRGVSDFYASRHGLKSGRKLQRNLTEGAAVQAAIAWIQKYSKDVTAEQAAAIKTASATRTQTIPTQRGPITRNVQQLPPGSVIGTRDQEYTAGPLGHATAASGFIEIFSASLRTLGVRWMLPEFLISGDASNANYASTLAAASPFGRARTRDQIKLGNKYSELMRKILRLLASRGLLAAFGVNSADEFTESVSLSYIAPLVEVGDELDRVHVAQAKAELGIPMATVQRELGYTPEDLQTPAGTSGGGDVPAASVPDVSGGDAAVADTALNGAQIASLMDIVSQVAVGALPLESAKAIILSAFPTMSLAMVESITKPLQGFVPAVTPDGKPVQQTQQAAAANPAISAMSRLQQSRNFKSVVDLLSKVAAGTLEEKVAAVLMRQLAIPDEDVSALLADAGDGKIDSLQGSEATASESADIARTLAIDVHCHRVSRDVAVSQLMQFCGISESAAQKLIGVPSEGTNVPDWENT